MNAIDTLLANDFEIHDEIAFSELNEFLAKNKWRYTPLYFINFFMTLGIAVLLFISLGKFEASFLHAVFYILCGLVVSILLIPIHEYIHFLAFKSLGAKHVKIISFFQKFYFLTIADSFVVDKRNIKVLALTPFLMITILGIALVYFVSLPVQLSICTALLFHSNMCTTDFRLIDYLNSGNTEYKMAADFAKETTYILKRTN